MLENICSSFTLLRLMYQFVCICKLVDQFQQKVRLIGSLWTGFHDSVSYSTVMMPKYGSPENVLTAIISILHKLGQGEGVQQVCESCYGMFRSMYCRGCQLAPFCAHEPCAGVVWASRESRLGSFTQVWVV